MNNSKGMSLAGVLTATALMTILMVGFLTFFTDLLKGQKHLEQKFGSVYLHNEIYQTLSNEPSCSMTFANKEFTYNATQSASVYTDVVQIKSGNNQVLYSTINDTTNPNKFYDGNNLKIKEIKFHKYTPKETPADANDIKYYSGYAFVQIEYEKNQKNIGNQTFVKEVKLDVTLKKQGAPIDPANPAVTYTAADDKKLKSCYALGGQGGDSYWQPTLAADGIFYSGGKVGVGTAAPDTDFQVTRNGASPRLAIRNPEELPVFFELAGTAGVNGNEGFEIEYTNTGDTYLRNRYFHLGTGSMFFQTNTSTFSSGVVNNNLTLHGNGNVGIGELLPNERFAIKSDNSLYKESTLSLGFTGISAKSRMIAGLGAGGATAVTANWGHNDTNGIRLDNTALPGWDMILEPNQDLFGIYRLAPSNCNPCVMPPSLFRINGNGRVGISKDNPDAKLHIDSASDATNVYISGVRVGNHTTQIRMNDNNTGKGWLIVNGKTGPANNHFQIIQADHPTDPLGYSYPFTILENGNIGLDVVNPTYQLQLSTDSAAKPGSAAWTVASDIRLKNITGEFTKGLNEILAIDPIYFNQHMHLTALRLF